jgi:hypothetical protein
MKNLKQSLLDAQTEMQKTIGQSFKPFFEKHPEVLALGWDQYTDYFNDGDECKFHIHSLEVKFNPECVEVEGEDNRNLGFIINEYNYEFTKIHKVDLDAKELKSDLKEIEKILQDDEKIYPLFLGAFGDHARVELSKDSINITEYTDHN